MNKLGKKGPNYMIITIKKNFLKPHQTEKKVQLSITEGINFGETTLVIHITYKVSQYRYKMPKELYFHVNQLVQVVTKSCHYKNIL